MAITSIQFLAFVVLVLAIYYALPRRPQNYWLLLASYAFYTSWAWQFAATLAALTAINYLVGRRLEPDRRGRRLWLWAGIGVNVAALIVFKYADFYLPRLLAFLEGLDVRAGAGGIRILLPMGLSFIVVQAIAYLVDVYRGQMQPTGDPLDFALFFAYFPKLLSGPIERARAFLPVLAQDRVVDNDLFARSFTLIVIGLVRKVVIADTLMSVLEQVAYEDVATLAAPVLWVRLIVYSFALYNDFAGYTSIVRGVSGLFGIELSPNFRHPYFARNFTEFWNRWHITLSHWLRDYIYYPLSRALLRRNPSRRSAVNLILPPVVTMLVSALWHGINPHVLVWGAMHGIYQVVERIPSLWRPVIPPQKWPVWRQGAATGAVFVLAILAWVPFQMSLPETLVYWRGLFTWTRWVTPSFRYLVALAPPLALDWVQYHFEDEVVFLRWPRVVQVVLLAFTLIGIFLFAQADFTGEPFVYQGF
jgi:alginate O-acetyltransferase complex protein AlgI